MQIVETFDEQQIRDLLHHIQRIRDPAGSQHVQDLVNFAFDFACDQFSFLVSKDREINLPVPELAGVMRPVFGPERRGTCECIKRFHLVSWLC